MNKLLILFVSLFLVGCSSSTRGVKLELNLENDENLGYVWRCYSSDEEIITITEENYLSDDMSDSEYTATLGVYQFKFSSVSVGEVQIICEYTDGSEDDNLYNIVYSLVVDRNKFINLLDKSGSYFKEEIPNPIFR